MQMDDCDDQVKWSDLPKDLRRRFWRGVCGVIVFSASLAIFIVWMGWF